ncbi:hypothetical protein AAG906_013849 [Vitis piasezkii]|uniref:CLAVATA3/ESR (CLE)-related protein 13 n=2 Tax=Vitis vinifera TaxID=29760 RepID=A0ABY9DNK1_VITVI|nr:CLAVATA3/ESR (CLE)-related protein 12 [Vitis vinifera]WKA08190.1 hypothetical protein VitviT2T_025933 [Vitis vinifera]
MAPKLTPQSLSIILCLSLLLLFFLGLGSFISIKPTRNSISHSINRKVLATKFDFTAFHGESHSRHLPPQPDPADSEIDPLYGVEKRKVPTGPNPLHH